MRCLSLSGPCILFRVMVMDKSMIILYAIISCDQSLVTLFFSVWEILRGFYSPFNSLSLSSFSLLSLPPSLYLSFYLSFSLFLFSLFSLSFSLDYLMNVFVLVIKEILLNRNYKVHTICLPLVESTLLVHPLLVKLTIEKTLKTR